MSPVPTPAEGGLQAIRAGGLPSIISTWNERTWGHGRASALSEGRDRSDGSRHPRVHEAAASVIVRLNMRTQRKRRFALETTDGFDARHGFKRCTSPSVGARILHHWMSRHVLCHLAWSGLQTPKFR
jgi:hypothetical protein